MMETWPREGWWGEAREGGGLELQGLLARSPECEEAPERSCGTGGLKKYPQTAVKDGMALY